MTWTLVAKPTESSVTSNTLSGGEPIGLLMALTQTIVTGGTSVITGWTGVQKPTSSVWTVVPKPTTTNWTNIAKPTT